MHMTIDSTLLVILGSLGFISLLYTLRLQHINRGLEKEKYQLQVELTHLKQSYQMHQQHWSNLEKQRHQQEHQTKEHFSHLSQHMLQQQAQNLQKQNHLHMQTLLHPLKEQIHTFQQSTRQQHIEDTKQRSSLTSELHRLTALNQTLSTEAHQLTEALKGDNKIQGNWGESILEKILEDSGLRLGHEYTKQTCLKDENDRTFKPDIIIHLPDDRQVVIDSKMSLKHYEEYFHAKNIQQKQEALKFHIKSIKNHVKELSKKNYHLLHGIETLDYVLMFIPIESAFSLAIQEQPQLCNESMRSGILLTSPCTLHVALKTIEYLWRLEHQHQHAQQIAHKAGQIYDKIAGFTEDMRKVGQAINQSGKFYQQAVNKLYSGRGSVVQQAKQMKELGAPSQKEIAEPFSTHSIKETL